MNGQQNTQQHYQHQQQQYQQPNNQQQNTQQQNTQQQNIQQQNNQQQKKQYYLFYSKTYCEHSKRCMDRLTKNGLLNELILCNIDDDQLNIPPFITSVPTLYLSTERRVLVNKDLFGWIEENNKLGKEYNNELSMNEVTGDANIFAFHQTEMGISGGNSYAFIDDKQNDMLSSSYELLDGSNKEKMNMPVFTKANTNMDSSNDGGSNINSEKQVRQNELSNAYDKLMAERASEMKNSITHMRT